MSLGAGLIVCLLIIISIGIVSALFNKEANLTIVIIDHREQSVELEDEEIIEKNNMEEITNDTQYPFVIGDDTKETTDLIQYTSSEVSEEVNQALGLFFKDLGVSQPVGEEKEVNKMNDSEKVDSHFEKPLPDPPPENENRLDILYADRNVVPDEHFESTIQNIDHLASTIDPSPEPKNELETLLGFVQYNPKNQKTEMTIRGTNSIIALIDMDGCKGEFIIEGSYIQPKLFAVESYDSLEEDIAGAV